MQRQSLPLALGGSGPNAMSLEITCFRAEAAVGAVAAKAGETGS